MMKPYIKKKRQLQIYSRKPVGYHASLKRRHGKLTGLVLFSLSLFNSKSTFKECLMAMSSLKKKMTGTI